jgi:hypothetical protein
MADVIKIYPEYYQSVVTGKKRSTIRKGRKNYELGDATLDFGDRSLDVYITAIMLKPYGLLDDEDAIDDGFDSLEDLQAVITSIHPDVETFHDMTIVFFDLKEDRQLPFCPYNTLREV